MKNIRLIFHCVNNSHTLACLLSYDPLLQTAEGKPLSLVGTPTHLSHLGSVISRGPLEPPKTSKPWSLSCLRPAPPLKPSAALGYKEVGGCRVAQTSPHKLSMHLSINSSTLLVRECKKSSSISSLSLCPLFFPLLYSDLHYMCYTILSTKNTKNTREVTPLNVLDVKTLHICRMVFCVWAS